MVQTLTLHLIYAIHHLACCVYTFTTTTFIFWLRACAPPEQWRQHNTCPLCARRDISSCVFAEPGINPFEKRTYKYTYTQKCAPWVRNEDNIRALLSSKRKDMKRETINEQQDFRWRWARVRSQWKFSRKTWVLCVRRVPIYTRRVSTSAHLARREREMMMMNFRWLRSFFNCFFYACE